MFVALLTRYIFFTKPYFYAIIYVKIVKGYTKISSKAKNVTLKVAPSNVRSATFDIFLDIFSFKCN
jgi:hypothetical protein